MKEKSIWTMVGYMFNNKKICICKGIKWTGNKKRLILGLRKGLEFQIRNGNRRRISDDVC